MLLAVVFNLGWTPAPLLSGGLKGSKKYAETLCGKPCFREVQISGDKEALKRCHISTVPFSRTWGHICDPPESPDLLGNLIQIWLTRGRCDQTLSPQSAPVDWRYFVFRWVIGLLLLIVWSKLTTLKEIWTARSQRLHYWSKKRWHHCRIRLQWCDQKLEFRKKCFDDPQRQLTVVVVGHYLFHCLRFNPSA